MKGLACLKSPAWWNYAGTRALKSTVQGALVLLPTTGFLLGEVSWIAVASGALAMGVVSLLTSLGGIPEMPDPSA